MCIFVSMNHADILDMLGTLSEIANGLNVKPNTARGWKRRKRIPSDYWPAVLELARTRGKYISPEHLMMAERRAA